MTKKQKAFKAEKIEQIKERKSNFATKLMAQRKAAQARIKFRSSLDTGVALANVLDKEDEEMKEYQADSISDGDEKELLKDFEETKKEKPKPVKKKSDDEGLSLDDGEDGLDDDEKVDTSVTKEGKPVKDYVLEYYQGFKDQGISGSNAAQLTLATILGEVGVIIRSKRFN